MKLSIITVTYNRFDVLESCLQSIAAQKQHLDFEYVLVDGNSNDGTTALLTRYSSIIDKLIIEPDSGIYEALNKGILACSGDIIGFLHSDDVYENEMILAMIFQLFRVSPDVDVISGKTELFDSSLNKKLRAFSSDRWRIFYFILGVMPPHCSTFIRKYVYQELGYFDQRFNSAADFDFFLRILIKKKFKIIQIEDVLIKMRAGGKSTLGWRSYIRTTKEIAFGLRKNKLFIAWPLLILRFLVKKVIR